MEMLILPLLVFIVVILVIVSFRQLNHFKKTADDNWHALRTILKNRRQTIREFLDETATSAISNSELMEKLEIAYQKESSFPLIISSAIARTTEEFETSLQMIISKAEQDFAFKSSSCFQKMHVKLTAIEKQLEAGKKEFNASATNFNNKILRFPGSLLAAMAGYNPYPSFTYEKVI